MDLTQAADEIQALIRESTTRPDTARLRDIIDHVENALSHGVTHDEMHQWLTGKGFKFKLNSFERALSRIRAERGARGTDEPKKRIQPHGGAAKSRGQQILEEIKAAKPNPVFDLFKED